MSITLRATLAAREVVYHHASILGAVEHGMALKAFGMRDVRVIDGTGREHCPARLYTARYGTPERPAPAIAA